MAYGGRTLTDEKRQQQTCLQQIVSGLGSGHPTERRAISTAVDILIALVIISASVLMLGLFLETDDSEQTHEQADRSAETIAALTMTAEYDLNDVQSHSDFDAGKVGDDSALSREVHGPITGLISDAAVTGVEATDSAYWDQTGQVTVLADPFEADVSEGLYARMANAETNVYVFATWEPFPASSFRGEATAGDLPPQDTDINSVTTSVPTRFDSVNESSIAEFDELANATTESIVEGYFPERSTQLALEQRGTERQLTLYRYKQFESLVNTDLDLGEPADADSPLNRSEANATDANEQLIEAISPRLEDDLRDSYGDVDAALAEMRLGRTAVTVQTW